MRNYTNRKYISKKIIQEHHGLEGEILTYFKNYDRSIPFVISCFGITYPDKNYYIKRWPSTIFVLEYVVSGKGIVMCNGKKHEVKQNDIYLIKPGDNCEYYADNEQPYKKCWINFQSSLFKKMLEAYHLENETVFENINILPYFERLFEIEKLSIDNSIVYPEVGNIIFQILTTIAKKINTRKNDLDDIAKKILYELEQYITIPFNLNIIAENLAISKQDINKYFKSAFNITPYKYLLNLRIEYAKELLINSNKTLFEIANMFCFSNEYHFSNTFKKHTGLSPTNFRKLHSQN